MFTQWFNDGTISMIQACGGHGYLMASGLGPMLWSGYPNVILEGENTILLLQIAKELLKSFNNAMTGKTKSLVGSLKYFTKLNQYQSYQAPKDKPSYRKTQTYIDIFSKMVLGLVQKSGTKMQDSVKKGMKPNDAFDQIGALTIVDAAKVHSVLFTLKFFNETVKSLAEGAIKIAFQRLAILFCIDQLCVFTSQAIEVRAVNEDTIAFVKEIYEELLDEVHADAFVLCEGWGYTDEHLRSDIGHSNGKPYENLLNNAKKNGMLNQFDVHPTMLEYIKNQEALKSGVANKPNPKL